MTDQAQRAKYFPTNPPIAEAPMNGMENSAMDGIKNAFKRALAIDGLVGKALKTLLCALDLPHSRTSLCVTLSCENMLIT